MPSVGLGLIGAQVGEATWLFRCRGGRRAPWSWAERSPDPCELEPVRETKSGRLSRNIPVQAMSVTTGGWLFLESSVEHELSTWLDRQRDVTWLVGQPVLLRWEDGAKHFPDLLSAHRDGTVTIWDARLPEERDETFEVMATRTRAACEKVGWRYELFGGLDPVASLNLRWIASARRAPGWLDPAPPGQPADAQNPSTAQIPSSLVGQPTRGHCHSACRPGGRAARAARAGHWLCGPLPESCGQGSASTGGASGWGQSSVVRVCLGGDHVDR